MSRKIMNMIDFYISYISQIIHYMLFSMEKYYDKQKFIQHIHNILNMDKNTSIQLYDVVTNENEKNISFLGIKYLEKNWVIKFSKNTRNFQLNAYDFVIQKRINREQYFFETFHPSFFPVNIPKYIRCFSNDLLWKSCLITEKIEDYHHIPHKYTSDISTVKFCIERLASIHSIYHNSNNNPTIWWLKDDKNSDIFDGIYLYKYKYSTEYMKLIDLLSSYVNTLPQTLVHGDYRVGNILFKKSKDLTDTIEDMIILDWQTVMMNNGLYDMAYLLCMSLDTEKREQYEDELLSHYLHHLSSPVEHFIPWNTSIHTIYNIMQLVMVCLYFHLNKINYYDEWGCSDTDAKLWNNRFIDVCKNINGKKINQCLHSTIDFEFIQQYLIDGYE
jgi:thiamine kinase-like enzyme